MNAAEKPELVFHQQGEARAIIQTEKYEQLLKEAAR
jgi:hypothetical protein